MSHSLPQQWRVVSSEHVLKTPWLNVRRDTCQFSDKTTDDYFVVERGDTASVIAVTTHGQVVLNWQYRHGIQKVVLEAPVGFVDAGENVLAAAQRELKEETGYTAIEWIPLARLYPNPGLTTSTNTLFLALSARQTETPEKNPREEIVNELVSLKEVERRLTEGEIVSMWTLNALEMAIRWMKAHNRYPV